MKKMFVTIGLFLGLAGAASADSNTTPVLVDNDALAYNQNLDLDLSFIESLAMQALYSSMTLTTSSFDDGRKATATITVSNNAYLVANTNNRLSIGTVVLRQGGSWSATSTSTGTAKAISDAINANATLSAVMVSAWGSNGVVYATSTAVGTDLHSYGMVSSSQAALGITSFSGGLASDNSLSADTVVVDNHRLGVGVAVRFSKASGTAPVPLIAETTYYALPVTSKTVRLSTTSADAQAGTYINLLSQTGSGSFSLVPVPIAGVPSFKWQVSNDGTTFTDITATVYGVAVSSVSMTSFTVGGVSTAWDFGSLNYKMLRCAVIAPTAGAIDLKIVGSGTSRKP